MDRAEGLQANLNKAVDMIDDMGRQIREMDSRINDLMMGGVHKEEHIGYLQMKIVQLKAIWEQSSRLRSQPGLKRAYGSRSNTF